MSNTVMTTHVILKDGTLLHVLGPRAEVRDRICTASGSYPWVDLKVIDKAITEITLNSLHVYVVGNDHEITLPDEGKPGAPNKPASDFGGGLEVNL